jgi:hypothetical protein
MARHPWPHTPDEDDPPIGVSVRPLGPDQLPPLSPPPEPSEPALPEPTSRRTIVFGKPGASAMAQYRRRRAAEWTDYLRTLPLRLGAIAAAALLAGTLARHAGLAAPAAILAAGGLAFLLRFRVSAETTAWRRGAKGEQLTARRLRRRGRGWTVFHDLAIPGSRANADHLVSARPESSSSTPSTTAAASPSAPKAPSGTATTHSPASSLPSAGKPLCSPRRSAPPSPRWSASTAPSSPGAS